MAEGMMRHRGGPTSRKAKTIDPEDLDRLIGELVWAKERGYVFRELEEAVHDAYMRREISNEKLR
jgi:hypothetical protein